MNRLVLPNGIMLGEVKRLLSEGSDVVIMTKGSSMLPFIIGDKDSVLIRKFDQVGKGDIVLAEVSPDVYILHRVWETDGEKVTLMGDGNVRGREHCMMKNVCGTVVEIQKGNGRRIDALSAPSRRKASLWRALLPLRRYLLAIYRRSPSYKKALK